MESNNECPKCNSTEIKIEENENDFARVKPEGEKAKSTTINNKQKYFCFDCKHRW